MNKEKYKKFCETTYVPIYSKPWWMDAICGEENWDVWLYENETEILAAMPYYIENRGDYKYITKAPLTQNNGIVFKESTTRKLCSQAEFEEKIIRAACGYIKSLGIDVYEQQYMYSFQNWLPFFWERYSAITRYTYVVEKNKEVDDAWNDISSNYRKKIRKGQKNCRIEFGIDKNVFYDEHEKIFLKQNLQCPFSRELWYRLYDACQKNNAGKIVCAKDENENIESLIFWVWDEKSMYQLLGGSMPEYQKNETYAYLIWNGIEQALHRGLNYDFEGSVIPQISKSFREFGGVPKPYFRIRKIFNPEIIRAEAEAQVALLKRTI